MRHGFSLGCPFTRTSTGSGFRQPGLRRRARAALTSTYGLTPMMRMRARNASIDGSVDRKAVNASRAATRHGVGAALVGVRGMPRIVGRIRTHHRTEAVAVADLGGDGGGVGLMVTS